MLMNFLITLVIGFTGGKIAKSLKIPAGLMIGSMLSVAVYNIFTSGAAIPPDMRIVTQIAAGAFIGSDIKRKEVLALRNLLKPALLMLSGMLLLSVVIAIILWKLTGIDFVTALFASAPGGVMDMTLISQEMGADASKVAILQLFRLIVVISLFPTILRAISVRYGYKDQKLSPAVSDRSDRDGKVVESTADPVAVDSQNPPPIKKNRVSNILLTAAIATIGGLLGYLLKVPAGAITFSMAAAAVFNISSGRGYVPGVVRNGTQVVAGVLIGAGVTIGDVYNLKGVIVPAMVLLFGFIFMNIILAVFISKTGSLDLITALFSSAPGGLTDMALIASELGADAPKVALLQLSRIICVISLFPWVIKGVTAFLM